MGRARLLRVPSVPSSIRYRFMIVTEFCQNASSISNAARGLTDVFICKLMRESDSLRLVLDRLAVHDCKFELLHNSLVDGITLTSG